MRIVVCECLNDACHAQGKLPRHVELATAAGVAVSASHRGLNHNTIVLPVLRRAASLGSAAALLEIDRDVEARALSFPPARLLQSDEGGAWIRENVKLWRDGEAWRWGPVDVVFMLGRYEETALERSVQGVKRALEMYEHAAELGHWDAIKAASEWLETGFTGPHIDAKHVRARRQARVPAAGARRRSGTAAGAL